MDADLDAVLAIGDMPSQRRTMAVVRSTLSPDFVEKHPGLVDMLVSARLKPEILSALIERLRRVKNGSEDSHEASVAVGQQLLNAYMPRGAT
jgi:hypothetical protein